jgi:hypothetical protein
VQKFLAAGTFLEPANRFLVRFGVLAGCFSLSLSLSESCTTGYRVFSFALDLKSEFKKVLKMF